MTRISREGLSMTVIKLSLGVGGSFLSAAFILEAYLLRSFMIPAAACVFVLSMVAVYLFVRIKPPLFSLATGAWLLVLFLLVA
jgi:hypothetical protein